MDTTKKNKLFYIGIITIFLLLCIAIGVSRYDKSSQGQDNTNPAPSSFTNGEGGKFTPSLDTQRQPLSLCATKWDNIGNAVLVGIFYWLESDYAKQLRQNDDNSNGLAFTLRNPHYILAAVVGAAMVGYIGYFLYQKYLVDQIPAYSLRKDVVIFALASFLTRVVFYPLIYAELEKAVEGTLQRQREVPLFVKILVNFVSSVVVYILAIFGIEMCKSNGAIEMYLFGPASDTMELFSILVLSGIHTIMHPSTAPSTLINLLWAIPFCFLYVKAYDYQPLPSSGYENIDGMMASLFHTSHLWEGLGCVLMMYHAGVAGSSITTIWFVWLCCKYALSHLDIKKNSDTGDYTASFPLTFTALLEGAFMILFVAFGLRSKFFPNSLATPFLYGASVLAAGLFIKLYFIDDKRTMVQWGGHLAYGLLSIGGSVVAGYCAWHNSNKTLQAIAFGSCIVFSLCLIPKFLNLITTASLAVADMPPFLQTIARITQGFTALWLQPNLDVVCTAIVMGAGCIYTYSHISLDNINGTTTLHPIAKICLIALALYLIIEVIRYNAPAQIVQIVGFIVQHGIFGLAFASMVACSTNSDNAIKWFLRGLFCYLVVGLWVKLLLDIVVQKDYIRLYLPILDGWTSRSKFILCGLLSVWGVYLTYTDNVLADTLSVCTVFGGLLVTYLLPKGYEFPSGYLRPALTGIKRYAIFSLSSVLVGYCCLYQQENNLLFIIGCLVGLLYILPKCMQGASTRSLTWTGMPSSLQKIALAIQGFTDLWLQPNLDVVCTAIVMVAGFIYQFVGEMNDCSFAWEIIEIRIILALLVALVAYFIIEGVRYKYPTYTYMLGVLAHGIFSLVFAAMVACSTNSNNAKWFLRGLLGYLVVGLLIQELLDVVVQKDYIRVYPPHMSKTILAKLKDWLYASYTYVYQLLLRWLKESLFTAGTPSTSPTDVSVQTWRLTLCMKISK